MLCKIKKYVVARSKHENADHNSKMSSIFEEAADTTAENADGEKKTTRKPKDLQKVCFYEYEHIFFLKVVHYNIIISWLWI